MEDGDWDGGAQAIGMYLNGHGIAGKDARGGTITDDHFLLYFNADGPAEVTLPPDGVRRGLGHRHRHRRHARRGRGAQGRGEVALKESSLMVLREYAEPDRRARPLRRRVGGRARRRRG